MKLNLKFKRYQLMQEHSSMVRSGKFIAASRILRFLNSGFIRLAFDDVSWECEQALERCGFHISINPRTGMASCTVHWKG